MYVLIIFKNVTYNLEIKEDISIINLKNLVSKQIKRVKTSFDLMYNQKILPDDELSLFSITKGARNARIKVLLKRSHSNNNKISLNKKIELPLIPSSSKINITTNEDSNLKFPKLNLNETETNSNSSSKELNKISESFQTPKSCKKVNQRNIEYKTKNKVFEDIYKNKEETIINLMNELKNKILELDDVLYRKNKKGYNKNNKIVIYEKNIINYKDKQIQFLKNLLQNFEGKKTPFSEEEINLSNFYFELSNYNTNKNTNIFIQNYSLKNGKKNINSTFNKENIQKKAKSENKNKEIIKNDPFKKKEQSKDSFFNDNDNNDKSKDNINDDDNNNDDNNDDNNNSYYEKLKEKTDKIFVDKMKNSKRNIPIKLYKSMITNSENLNSKKIEQINKMEIRNNNKDKNVNKYINNKSYEDPKNQKIESSKPISYIRRELDHSFDIKKIQSLFEIAEKKNESSENNSDNDSEDSENLNQIKLKRKQVIEKNLKNRRHTLNLGIGESLIGYRTKQRERKATQRIKKLGNVYSDFVI